MATEIVQQWITKDVRLSKLITSFESDFANGYLFGELLQQFNLIDDLSSFSKKTNKESKVKNFQQVESILRDLKIKFDGKLIHQIMNEERGAALRLLYQIRLAVTKNSGETNTNMMTTTNLKIDTVNKKLADMYQLKSTLPGTTNLSTMNKSKKLEPIEKTLLTFEYKKKQMEDKAYNDHKNEQDLIQRLLQDQRQDNLRKMDENKTFMKEWEEEGKQNWKKNQKTRKDAIARQKHFEDKEVTAFKAKLNKELDEATNELIGGIDEFERNLQKLGIEKNNNIQDAIKKMEEKKGIPPGQIQNFSYAATMNKIKEKKNVQDFAAKERDRRRRKMVVDQAKTQYDLDNKKNEEQLIQKLLKKQAEEHKFAYLEQRTYKCKQIVVQNRAEKAYAVDEERRIQREEYEKKRLQEQQKEAEQYKKEIQDQKKIFDQNRRKEKLAKRSVNIEICSEVLDQIMDIANEAWEETKGNNKLDKPMWREWMGTFQEGQTLSKVRRGPDELSSFIPDEDLAGEYDVLNDNSKKLEDVLDVVKYEKDYEDLLDYLSVSGLFNLTSGSIPEWNSITDLSEGVQLDFKFLENITPFENPILGKSVSEILSNFWKEDKTDKVIEPIKPAEGLPHHLILKLCLLGKLGSGKRTIAKQLVDYYQGRIKILKMDEMIKEVLDYINPKPVQEIPDMKAKKAPAKKMVEEPQFVDQYAGQDTREYKEIGQQIKKILGDNEIKPGTDLYSLINDDNLLVKLLIQKLKLTFPADKPESVKQEELKTKLAREKEILEQLAEIETQAIPDPKAKAPQKAPKKGGVSNEDQLKSELELLQKIQPDGFVLLDFPRTIHQAKIMEQMMTGFTCQVDDLKPLEQKKYEQWSKLVRPPSECDTEASSTYNNSEEPQVYKSAMDAFLFVDPSRNECQRRFTNRKIDPTTQTIYHMEDNPPPENDIKLKDRLQDYNDQEGESWYLNNQHIEYTQNVDLLKKWISSFGLQDQQLEKVQVVSSLMEVQYPEKKRKDEVWEMILKQIQKVISFKQDQYDFKKQQMKEQIEQEKRQCLLEQQVEATPVQEEEKQEEPVVEEQQNNLTQQEYLKSDRQVYSTQSKRSRVSEQKPQPLNDDQKRDIWSQFETSYYKVCMQVFRSIRRQRDLVFEGLNQMQNNFIDFLQRPDNKQSLVDDFIESYNKFSAEFPDLKEDAQTQDELLNRVNKLSNDLWAIIENKKDQAIAQHAKLVSEGWVIHEIKKLIRNSIKVIQLEINKFTILYKIVTSIKQYEEINVESVFNQFIEDGIKIVENDMSIPIVDRLFKHILQTVQQQQYSFYILEENQKTMLNTEVQNLLFRLNLIKTWLSLKVKEFNQMQKQLYDSMDDWIVVAVQRENELSQASTNKLTTAISQQTSKLEYHQFKIGNIDIQSYINRLHFGGKPEYIEKMEIPSEINEQRFKVEQLDTLYKQFRQNSFEEYLDGQTFIHLMVLSLQDDKVPKKWRFYDFSNFNDIIRKFKVQPDGQDYKHKPLYYSYMDENNEQIERDFINWKKLFTLVILGTSDFYDQNQFNDYFAQLEEVSNENNGEISLDQFLNIPAWFDKNESYPEFTQSKEYDDEDYGQEEIQLDHERLAQIKRLLFRTYQTNTGVLKFTQFRDAIKELKELKDTEFGTYSEIKAFNLLFNF